MKKIILGLAFTLFSIFTVSASDCFDAAIKSLEQAEAKYLNHAYGNCVTWMATQ